MASDGSAAEEPRWRGRPLAEALLALAAQGVPIVFTSAVVRDDLVVAEEPRAREPRAVLDELLRPHGLGVRESPDGVLVVVPAADGAPRAAELAGEVRAGSGGDPIAGARVRIVGSSLEATTDEAGRFDFGRIEPGGYELRVEATGFLERRVERVTVGREGGQPLQVELAPSPFVEDEITVRPSVHALLGERPVSPLALDRQAIDSLPHLGDDLFRAISLLPGAAANDVTAQFALHGGRRDEVEIRLDGQELYDAFHLAEYDNATSVVSARSLASARLATGAYPADRGDRMGGVLELETAEPEAGRSSSVGVGALDLSASSGGRFADAGGHWLAHARRGALDLAADAIGEVGPAYWDLFGKVDFPLGRGRLAAHWLAARDELELDEREEESFETLETDYTKSYLWLLHQTLPADRLLVETLASWASSSRDRAGVGSEEKGDFALDDRRELEVWEAAQSFGWQGEGGRVARGGWQLRRYEARFDYARALEPAFEVIAPFALPREEEVEFDESISSDHLGLWASERRSFESGLAVEIGLRFDRHEATDEALWSPRLSVAWRIGEASVVRAAWGRFFQSHRPYELGVEDGETALERAERTDHALVGVEVLLPQQALGVAALRLEAYWRDLERPRRRAENLLEAVNYFQEVEPDRVRLAPESGESRGLELSVRGRAGLRVEWWIAYAWARAEERVGGLTAPRELDQRHALTLDLALALPRDWSLNLAWRTRTGWPTTPVATVRIEDPEDPGSEPELAAQFGALGSQRLPGYHRLDLRASRLWTLSRGTLTFYLDLQNAYGRDNLAGFGLTLDDEVGEVVLEPESWPGVFPSLGLVWAF